MALSDNSAGAGGWGSLLGPALNTAANIYGSQNAAEAQTRGNAAGIATQQSTMGNITGLYAPQYNLGSGAFNALGSALGVNGQAPDYSGFLNMPGYQFAVSQGTQAINRNASAAGNLYSTSTLADVGKQVTGTALQDYNNYIAQLTGAAGFGASANQNLSGALLRTGSNISQLQVGQGSAQAGGYTGAAGALGSLPWGTISKGIGNLFNSGTNTSGVDPNADTGAGINSNGATIDPATGLPTYNDAYTNAFNNAGANSTGTGWDANGNWTGDPASCP
jgi:hypothetical protein